MRMRDTTRWGIGLTYPNKEFFTSSDIGSGLHTVQFGNQNVDLLVRDRGSDTTVITFHASVTAKSTFPFFVGDSFTDKLGVNLIALTDPGVALSNDLRLGWFIGHKAIGNFREVVTPLIEHVLADLGSRRTILWGSSGGGHAAVNYAQKFPEALTLVINPRLHLTGRPNPGSFNFVQKAYRTQGRTQFNRVWNTYVIDDLAEYYQDGLPGHIGVYQNSQDGQYYRGQFRPFVQKLSGDPRLWVRTEEDGEGHVHIPRDRMISMVSAMSDVSVEPASAMQNAGFWQPEKESPITAD